MPAISRVFINILWIDQNINYGLVVYFTPESIQEQLVSPVSILKADLDLSCIS